MLFNIEFWYTEKFLPTTRHRNLRERNVKSVVDINIRELNNEEFPVAFIVHDYQSVYEDARSYDDFNGHGDYKMFSEEIRTFKGELYKPVRITHGAAISSVFEDFDYIRKQLENRKPWGGSENMFSENSIVKETNINEVELSIKENANNFIIFDDKVWKICGEPMYNVTTFGLGHNHGGTGFFIQYHYNPNIRKENYFNALERDQAIAYGKQTALNRGDTESVDGMGKHDIIEVLMPEMVKRNPNKEHGDGCEFLNSIENAISKTESTLEAGLLTMAFTVSEVQKKQDEDIYTL